VSVIAGARASSLTSRFVLELPLAVYYRVYSHDGVVVESNQSFDPSDKFLGRVDCGALVLESALSETALGDSVPIFPSAGDPGSSPAKAIALVMPDTSAAVPEMPSDPNETMSSVSREAMKFPPQTDTTRTAWQAASPGVYRVKTRQAGVWDDESGLLNYRVDEILYTDGVAFGEPSI
jgi:hypothetical protein